MSCRHLVLAFAAGLGLLTACVPPSTDEINTNIDVSSGSIDEQLDLHTHSVARSGCDAQLLIDGPASRVVFERLIEQAIDHLHVWTLNFDNDRAKPEDTAQQFADLFVAKAQSGIPVRMVVDVVTEQVFSAPEMSDYLAAGGVDLQRYIAPQTKPFGQLLHHSHEKILIRDGQEAIIGGMNYGYYYFAEGAWRDTNILLKGPVVADVQRDFLTSWERLTGTDSPPGDLYPPLPPDGPITCRYIDQHPALDDYDINYAILIAIRRAETRIDMEAPYFNPTPWLVTELINAVQRGVAVRILTNSRTAIDVAEVYDAMSDSFSGLVQNNIDVYLWNQPRTMHSKAVTVDDKLAIVGSINFNYRSLVWDTENVVVLTSPQSIQEVQAMIDADFSAPDVFLIDQSFLDAISPEQRSQSQFWLPLRWLF